MKKILGLIQDEFQTIISSQTVSGLKDQYLRYVSLDKFGNQYDEYTIEQFLIFYKIEKLYELGKISEQVYQRLRMISYLKIRLEKINTDFDESNNSSIQLELSKILMEFDQELEMYHLLSFDLDISQLMNFIIENEENHIFSRKRKKS